MSPASPGPRRNRDRSPAPRDPAETFRVVPGRPPASGLGSERDAGPESDESPSSRGRSPPEVSGSLPQSGKTTRERPPMPPPPLPLPGRPGAGRYRRRVGAAGRLGVRRISDARRRSGRLSPGLPGSAAEPGPTPDTAAAAETFRSRSSPPLPSPGGRRSGVRGRKDGPGPDGSAMRCGPAASRSAAVRSAGWCRGAESNRRHKDFQSSALPSELPRPGRRRRPGTERRQPVSFARRARRRRAEPRPARPPG